MKDLHSSESENAPFIEIDEGGELRCPRCNKLFAKGDIGDGGKVELKCPRCKMICRFQKL